MKIRFNLIGLVLLISILVGTSCSSEKIIKVLQTSDIHGSIFPYDYINNRPKATSLAHVSTYVKHERAKKNQTVILLDNGDIMQGQPTVYYSNFIDTNNLNIVSKTFNYLKYDAATLGNHDIETGPKVYNKIVKESNFPWLAANVTNTQTDECAFEPYKIIKSNGVKIAVIGMITPHIPYWLPKQMWPNMQFNDMIETAQKYVNVVKTEENPDIIIGLFHAGHDYTYGNSTADKYLNENASLLVASRISGFDAIMIGHDHDAFCQKIANNTGDSVLIIDPASNARYVAQTTITIKKNILGRIKSKEIKGELIPMDTIRVDEDFITTFGNDMEKVKSFVSEQIGVFTETISSQKAFVEPTTFIDFIHSCQLELTQADISFVSPLSFSSTIKEGKITVSDMFKLYKFENFLYTMKLTGAEIDKYLEFNANRWFNHMKSSNDHLLRFKIDSNGKIATNEKKQVLLACNYYNYDSAAGIIYTIDVSKPEGQKVTIVSMADGSPFIPEKEYVVAVNSYRGNGGGDHLTKGVGLTKEEIQSRLISSTNVDLRYCMMEHIKRNQTISPKVLNTWKLIPTSWTKEAAKRDLNLLFPTRK